MNIIGQPAWANAGKTQILLKLSNVGLGVVEFIADPYDCVAQGRELYSRAMAGEFGDIEDYQQYIPTDEQLASSARYERDKALKALDEVVSNPLRFSELSEEQQLEAATYRRLLLDVPQQKSFPVSYTLPESPEWLN